MDLLKIEIDGFKCFTEPVVFKFPEGFGFFSLTGENRAEPELGANAAGKTSFFDAICWCLYGRTARGVKASHICSWGLSGTVVSIDMKVGDRVYTLARSRNPNSLTVNEEIVEQSAIEDLIEIDYETFLATYLFGQFNRFFFDLSPTERLNVFSRVLGLDVWTLASKEATKTIRSLEKDIAELQSESRALSSSIQTLRESRQRLGSASATWEVEASLRVKERKREIKKLKRAVDSIELEILKYKSLLKRSRSQSEDNEREISSAVKDKDRLSNKLREERWTVESLENGIKAVKRQIHEVRNSAGSLCSTCSQPITKKYSARVIRDMRNQREDFKQSLERANERLKKLADKIATLEKSIRGLFHVADSLKQECADYSRAISERTTRVKTIQARVEEMQKRVDEDKENPYVAELKSIREKMDAAKKRLEESREEKRQKERTLHSASYWPKGFKELRLWVVEQSLAQLATEINSTLMILGLYDWSIDFEIERETKSGSLAKGFHVLIESPVSGSSVPWEMWSGGETQRLRIAGAVGLANLIASRVGIRPAFEVWDEPTAHLSEEGIADLLAFLAQRARSRQLWLVDHRSLTAGEFTDMYKVIKTDHRGSRIQAVRS